MENQEQHPASVCLPHQQVRLTVPTDRRAIEKALFGFNSTDAVSP
jgi:hypothetical protein